MLFSKFSSGVEKILILHEFLRKLSLPNQSCCATLESVDEYLSF